MAAMLVKRGPERTGTWHEGSAGLAHNLLATTPELQFEPQPFIHRPTGCVITADVRLDNRLQLLGEFDLLTKKDATGDAELILRAYLKWADNCVDHLLGDFAFAIHDARHNRLFCARDHFAMRPLYYHHAPGKRFVFASDARAILVLPQVPYQRNEGRIADFLVPELQWIDYTSTFYEAVYRLPPGHLLTVTPDRFDVTEYWQPQPGPDLGTLTDDEYREGFLEVFTKAVDSRLRAPAGTVSSMLSGGMDSGSVVAVGKELLAAKSAAPLPTYSAIQHRDIKCDESRAIYAAAEMPSISPTLIYPSSVADQFESMISDIEEPFDAEFAILSSIYDAAQAHDQNVVLDGAGGDVVLGEGSYIVRLFRQGKIRQALHEVAGEKTFWGGPSWPAAILGYVKSAYLPEALKRPLRPLLERKAIAGYLRESLIHKEFANRVDIQGRFDRMAQMSAGGWQTDYAKERSRAVRPNMTAGRERYARIAARFGVEARDPFMDKRVVDYCSRLPGHIRFRDGWPKMVLREIMAERLPDEVRWCRGKPHIGWLFNAAVTQEAIDREKLDARGLAGQLRDYVDTEALHQAWRKFAEGSDVDPLHAAHVLSVWLGQTENRPVVPD